MESGDILTTIAEIAIAIAGFSSVIVALSPKPISQWSPIERFNFRILLQVAAVTVFFSLIPLVLHRALSFDLAWRVALIFMEWSIWQMFRLSSFGFRITCQQSQRLHQSSGFQLPCLSWSSVWPM